MVPRRRGLTALLQGQAQQQGFTLEEVEQHNTEQDCLIIIKQRVRTENRPPGLPVSHANAQCAPQSRSAPKATTECLCATNSSSTFLMPENG